MTDPAQLLKAQIGELIWNNAVLVGRINELETKIKELEDKLPSNSPKAEE